MGWLRLWMGLLFIPSVLPLSQEEEERLPLAQIKETEKSGPIVAEFIWSIRDIRHLMQSDTLPGPEFYTGRPGYKVRLSVTTGQMNPGDGLQYMGVWFSLAPGLYDEVLEWPFPYTLNLTLVHKRKQHPEVDDRENPEPSIYSSALHSARHTFTEPRIADDFPDSIHRSSSRPDGRRIPKPDDVSRSPGDQLFEAEGQRESRFSESQPRRRHVPNSHHQKDFENRAEIRPQVARHSETQPSLQNYEEPGITPSEDRNSGQKPPTNHIPDSRFSNYPLRESDYNRKHGSQFSGYIHQGVNEFGNPSLETSNQNIPVTTFQDSASSHQDTSEPIFQPPKHRKEEYILPDPEFELAHNKPGYSLPQQISPGEPNKFHDLDDNAANSPSPNLQQPNSRLVQEAPTPNHSSQPNTHSLYSRQTTHPDASIHLTMNPTSALCRLRKQFLRPRNKRRGSGCGKAFFVPLNRLLEYASDDVIELRVTIFLRGRGPTPKRARVLMRGHQLVSEFHWNVNDAKRAEGGQLASDLFYLNYESYLLVLQLSFVARDDVGLFVTVVPGEYDDALQWPFAYHFEMSVTDEAGNERRGNVDPTSGTCPLQAFTRPKQRPNPPCGFRKLAGLAKNGSLAVKFTAVLDQMPHFAKLAVRDGFLVAEYVWRVPNIERKMQLARSDRLSNLLSERFYSQPQGYLLQLQLKFQRNATAGVFLTLLEGAHDHLLTWPFQGRFQLRVVDQQEGGDGGADLVVEVDPSDPYVRAEACSGSFWRPFGRNDACGSASAVDYEKLYDRKFIRYGAILLKVVLFLQEIRPPRFAALTLRQRALVARFEWRVPDIAARIRQSREGRLQFLDSDKFYVSGNGYRMMLRLYPEKAAGFAGLYAVLVRGAYDEELEWPFPHTFRLEAGSASGDAISRTTYPGISGSGCPDVAFKRPDRELAEWSCGEGRMVAHRTLLGDTEDESSSLQNLNSNHGAVGRFAVEVVLAELPNPPVGALRTDPRSGALLSRYSWLLRSALHALALLTSGEKETLDSPVFYTENQGYALQLSLSLSKHDTKDVGLHWTLQPGQNDEALSWPFRGPVTLGIVDGNGVKHFEGVTGPCSPRAFERPRGSNGKHSCGFPSLVTLDTLLSAFVYEDVLHVQVSVLLT